MQQILLAYAYVVGNALGIRVFRTENVGTYKIHRVKKRSLNKGTLPVLRSRYGVKAPTVNPLYNYLPT